MGSEKIALKKILVTGANGLLAGNIILELLNKNYDVRGTLRSKKKLQIPMPPNLEIFECDIRDNEKLDKAVEGCDGIIHIAALTSQSLPDYRPYREINIEATSSLINLAIKHKVKSFVFVSSANTFGYGSRDNPGNEQKTMRYPFTKSYYAKSKSEAQNLVLEARSKIKVSVVNPTFMIGPYDGKPSSGKIIMMGMKKGILLYPSGGKNFLHAGDAAIGTVKALEADENGECYILAGENLNYKQFYKKLHRHTGLRPVFIPVPGILLQMAGIFGSALHALGFKTDISMSNMKMLCIDNYYENKKATQDLGMQFRSANEAIKDALDWFCKKEML